MRLIIPGTVKVVTTDIVNLLCNNDRNSITEVTIEEGVQIILNAAFSKCINLKSVEFPSSLKIIKEYAFSGCIQLETILFKEGLEQICEYAFCNCCFLKQIKLPNSLNTLDKHSVYGCSGLEQIQLPDVCYIYPEIVKDVNDNCNIIYKEYTYNFKFLKRIDDIFTSLIDRLEVLDTLTKLKVTINYCTISRLNKVIKYEHVSNITKCDVIQKRLKERYFLIGMLPVTVKPNKKVQKNIIRLLGYQPDPLLIDVMSLAVTNYHIPESLIVERYNEEDVNKLRQFDIPYLDIIIILTLLDKSDIEKIKTNQYYEDIVNLLGNAKKLGTDGTNYNVLAYWILNNPTAPSSVVNRAIKHVTKLQLTEDMTVEDLKLKITTYENKVKQEKEAAQARIKKEKDLQAEIKYNQIMAEYKRQQDEKNKQKGLT